MTEEIIHDEDFREGIQKGINELANTVKGTLGPNGNTVIMRIQDGRLVITKDGISVANQIKPKNPLEDMGAELVRNVSMKSNIEAGDGTTTAIVLAQSLFNTGMKYIKNGENPTKFKQEMEKAKDDVLEYISKKKVDIKSSDPLLKDVISIAANGDVTTSGIIAGVYNNLGKNAVINAVPGESTKIEVDEVKGVQFGHGYISPYCIEDADKLEASVENPLILLYDGKLKTMEPLLAAFEVAADEKRTIVVIAEDIKEEALGFMNLNHRHNKVKSIPVTAPGHGPRRRQILLDIAAQVGGIVCDANTSMEDVDIDDLGECVSMEVSALNTSIIGGKGNKEDVDRRVALIQTELEKGDTDTYTKEMLEARLGQLTSGAALIKVGAHSKEERKELLDRVVDAKFAAKAALEEGIVIGAGLALHEASKSLTSSKMTRGYHTVIEAIKAPSMQILINGDESADITDAYIKQIKKDNVVDPYKVIRIALTSAVSIVSTLLTTKSAIINKIDII